MAPRRHSSPLLEIGTGQHANDRSLAKTLVSVYPLFRTPASAPKRPDYSRRESVSIVSAFGLTLPFDWQPENVRYVPRPSGSCRPIPSCSRSELWTPTSAESC